MKSISINSINFTLLKFIGFFTGSVFLCVIIVSSFWGPLPAQSLPEIKVATNTNQNNYEEDQLLQADRLLHSKWTRLEQLYSDQSLSLSTVHKSGTNTADKLIAEAEVSFKRTLDSIRRKNLNLLKDDKLAIVISSFELALKNRQSLTIINPVANNNSANDSLMKKQILNLQNDLQVKNVLLVKLQNQVNVKPAQTNIEATPSSRETKKMKDEIEFLKWALRSEVSSNHALTNSNNKLKQENASLESQVKGK